MLSHLRRTIVPRHHNIFRGCVIEPYTEELLSSLNQQKAADCGARCDDLKWKKRE